VVLLLSIRTGFLDELESRNGLSELFPGLCVLEGVIIGPIMMLTDCQATPARVRGNTSAHLRVDGQTGGMSRNQAARHFGVGISTAINWVKREQETGSVAPDKNGWPQAEGDFGRAPRPGVRTNQAILHLARPGRRAR